jgi:hypothetical protein
MSVVSKLFEVRDAATFIPVIATTLASDLIEEAFLIGRAGYSNFEGPTSVMVTRLHDCKAANDSFEWSNRTMHTAHKFIEENFQNLESGSVVDVQFILGERDFPRISERLEGLL